MGTWIKSDVCFTAPHLLGYAEVATPADSLLPPTRPSLSVMASPCTEGEQALAPCLIFLGGLKPPGLGLADAPAAVIPPAAASTALPTAALFNDDSGVSRGGALAPQPRKADEVQLRSHRWPLDILTDYNVLLTQYEVRAVFLRTPL